MATTAATPIRWTTRQAGYHAEVTEFTTTRGGGEGLPQHFVLTRHGVLARTWVGPGLAEVTLRRPRHAHGTYQGHVAMVPGGWAGYNHNGQPVTAICRDYLDAEAPLLRLRTGHTATGKYRWPAWMLLCTRPAERN
jgi:hypothetical protein